LPDDPSGIYVVLTPPGFQQAGEPSTVHGYNTSYPVTIHDPGPIPLPGLGKDITNHYEFLWISTDGNLDDTTVRMSHEIAEAMSDPYGQGVSVTLPSQVLKAFPNFANSGRQQIGDGEPEWVSPEYTFRVPSFGGGQGVLVQAYWSQKDDAFIVPDWHWQRLNVLSGYDSSGTRTQSILNFIGDQLGTNYNDTITIGTNSAGGVQVVLNGETFNFEQGAITHIYVFPGGGTNSIAIHGTPANVPVDVLDAGQDTVYIGSGSAATPGTLDSINADVHVRTAPSANSVSLTVDDGGDSSSRSPTLMQATLTGLGKGAISFGSGVTSLTIIGGTGGDTFSVLDTPSGCSTLLKSNGADVVNVGSGSMQQILGSLYIQHSAPSTTLSLDLFDTADPVGRTVSVSNDAIAGLAPAVIGYQESTLNALSIICGSSNNTIFFNDPGYHVIPGVDFGFSRTVYDRPSYTAYLNAGSGGSSIHVISTASPLTIDCQGVSDTLSVGNGTLAGIQGPVTIENAGPNSSLGTDNSADTGSHPNVYLGTLPSGSPGLSGLAPAVISWNPMSNGELDLGDGSGLDSYTINNPGEFETYISTRNANDPVTVKGSSGRLVFNGRTLAQAPAQFRVSGPSGPVTAGKPFQVTVTALDAQGNRVTSYDGPVTFTSSDGQTVYVSSASLVWSRGTATASITLDTAGTVRLMASAGAAKGTSGSIAVSAAAAASFAVSVPATATAGKSFTVTVTARDAYGNTATGYSGAVTFTSSDGQRVYLSPTLLKWRGGVTTFSITLDIAGTVTLTASTGTLRGTSGNLVVNPAAAVSFAVSAPSLAATGVGFSVTITARDQYGNTVTSYAGPVSLTTSTGQAVSLPSGPATLTSGTATVTVAIYEAGVFSLTASAGNISGTSNSITVKTLITIGLPQPPGGGGSLNSLLGM
jgi:hypothetical protein